MALKTAQEYIDSLRKLNLNVYLLGEKVENPVDHPIIRPSNYKSFFKFGYHDI